MIVGFGTKCIGNKDKSGHRVLDKTKDSIIAKNTIDNL